MTDLSPTAADCRRAAALISHHGQSNLDGLNAILLETAETGRVTPLLIALLDLYATLVPELRTPVGMAAMSSMICDLASQEVAE